MPPTIAITAPARCPPLDPPLPIVMSCDTPMNSRNNPVSHTRAPRLPKAWLSTMMPKTMAITPSASSQPQLCAAQPARRSSTCAWRLLTATSS